MLKNRLGRLVRLQGSDPGFFVLAVHAFVESWLREHLSEHRRTVGLGDLIYMYRQELRQKAFADSARYEVLGEISRFHDLTNAVRHAFKSLYPDEATAACLRLVRFCELASISAGPELMALRASMKLWEARSSHLEDHQKMENLTKELAALQKKEAGQSQLLEEYRGVKVQRDTLASEKSKLEAALSQERSARKAKDEKYDESRRKAAQLEMRIKELDDKLEDLTEARDVALDLTRMALYTRSRLEFERELSRLTPDQQRILDEIDLGDDFLIKGGAGTGKTLVLLKALAKLLDQAQEGGQAVTKSYVFITYSDTLVKYDRYIASIIDLAERNQRIQSADQYLQRLFNQLLPDKRIDQGAFESMAAEAAKGSSFNAADVQAELEGFLFANDVTETEYCIDRIDRGGSRMALDALGRLELWKIRTNVVERMEAEGLYSPNYARVRLAAEAKSDPNKKSLDIVFIDEVQDLTPCDLMAFKALCRGPVIMAGDNEQAIFRKGFSFKRAGLDIVGRSRTIKLNFRNTVPINELTERYREKYAADGGDLALKKAYERPSQAFRPGPPPELIRAAAGSSMLDILESRLRLYKDLLGYDPETMTVLVPDREIHDEVASFLTAKGLAVSSLDDKAFSFSNSPGVRLSLMKSAKGIDFAVTILYVPRLPKAVAEYDAGFNLGMLRNTIYVCLTRSMEQLAVLLPQGNLDPVLNDLVAAFEGGEW